MDNEEYTHRVYRGGWGVVHAAKSSEDGQMQVACDAGLSTPRPVWRAENKTKVTCQACLNRLQGRGVTPAAEKLWRSQEAERLYKSGWSIPDIAEALGVGIQKASQIVKEGPREQCQAYNANGRECERIVPVGWRFCPRHRKTKRVAVEFSEAVWRKVVVAAHSRGIEPHQLVADAAEEEASKDA